MCPLKTTQFSSRSVSLTSRSNSGSSISIFIVRQINIAKFSIVLGYRHTHKKTILSLLFKQTKHFMTIFWSLNFPNLDIVPSKNVILATNLKKSMSVFRFLPFNWLTTVFLRCDFISDKLVTVPKLLSTVPRMITSTTYSWECSTGLLQIS